MSRPKKQFNIDQYEKEQEPEAVEVKEQEPKIVEADKNDPCVGCKNVEKKGHRLCGSCVQFKK